MHEVTQDNYRQLVHAIITLLKTEKDHEGTSAVMSPTELLEKIAALGSDIKEVTDRVYGGVP